MKNIYFITAISLASLLVSGCGDDRSGGVYHKSKSAPIKKGFITETFDGKKMIENNFVYIPGGFDVDNDGVNEGGFWLAKYEARESNTSKGIADTSKVVNIQSFISKNFRVYNPKTTHFDAKINSNSGYTNAPASNIENIKPIKVTFNTTGKVVRNISPLEAVISLQNSQIIGTYNIALPTEKQWMHVVKLVINNKENWTGGEVGKGQLFQGNRNGIPNKRTLVIANSLLGDDDNVPKDYKVNVSDLSGGVAEWTSGMIQFQNRFLTGDSGKREYANINSIPTWWKPILNGHKSSLGSIEGVGQYNDGTNLNGANDTIIVKSDATQGFVDNYAVIARGGSNSLDDKTLVGISASNLNYGVGYQGPTVGFRAATRYLY